MTAEALKPPRSANPEALRQWGFALVNHLRVLFEDAGAGTENVLNEMEQIVGSITNFNDLTPAQKDELGLSGDVSDDLSIDDVFTEISRFAGSAAEAAIHGYLKSFQNESAVRVEQTAREGLAQQVTTLETNLGQTDAAIVAEQTARVNGDNALATDITTVTSTVAGHSTSISQHQASIDGIEAEWGVTINQQGQVVGLVRLDADQSESTFTVVVDKFQVAKTDGTGIVPIFQVGTVDGVSRVALAANMIVDGGIIARYIAASAITADKIAAGAITADKLDAGAVTADSLDVDTLDALSADLGTVTAGKLQSADEKMLIDLENKIIRIESLAPGEVVPLAASIAFTGSAVTVTVT